MMVTQAKVISDGVLKLDGGAIFGQVPKTVWETLETTDRKNRITLGLTCLALHVNGKNILVDTGMGSKYNDQDKDNLGLVPSRLNKNLRSVGLTPKDIDAVILTHLHNDHCGGCTRLDRTGDLVPTFPRATYYVQRESWNDANNPNERFQSAHRNDNFAPLKERGQIELLDGDSEIFPGLNVIVTGGHSPGHQILFFNHGGERLAFLGDLVPTHHHLNLPVISAFDYSPETTLDQKHEILDFVHRKGMMLVFGHGHSVKAGYMERRGETTYLTPVNMDDFSKSR